LKTTPRIVFFGTPDFAVASLKSTVAAGFTVAGVVTIPDKPSGRGLKMQYSPVKEFALAHNLPLLQPESLKDPQFLEKLREWEPALQIVVAFRILPESVWSLPPMGTFNLHASLLPQYRGAAPINRAIMNGEKETGITTFFLDRTVDTGTVIFSEKLPVGEEETAGELHDRLRDAGAVLVVRTIEAIVSSKAPQIVQSVLYDENVPLNPAPKIRKEDCRIDWARTCREIYNHVRGLSPYPGAFAEIPSPGGAPLFIKVFRCSSRTMKDPGSIGKIITDGKSYVEVSCADGRVQLLNVQAPGRNPMEIQDFLRGNAGVFFANNS
jgi:methionyl-tRNA formyltransferase